MPKKVNKNFFVDSTRASYPFYNSFKWVQMRFGTISASLVREWFKVRYRHGLSCIMLVARARNSSCEDLYNLQPF